jgi:hypothetical protein
VSTEERTDEAVVVADVAQIVIDQAVRDGGRLTPSSILMLATIKRAAEAHAAELVRVERDRDTMSQRVDEARDETWEQRRRAERAEAELDGLRAAVERVRRIAEADRLGLTTYGISRDDIFAALGAVSGTPEEPKRCGHGHIGAHELWVDHDYWDNGHGAAEHSPHCRCEPRRCSGPVFP